VLLIGGFTWYLDSVESAPVLTVGGYMGWWYRQDAMRQVDTSADGGQQTTVPIRLHQRQGFFVQINNDSRWTQTVLGFGRFAPQTLASETAQLQISVRTFAHDFAGNPLTDRYSLPVAIPPGQSRYLRLMWNSDSCEEKGGVGGLDQLTLEVRVGLFTRTEVIDLYEEWALEGTANCPPLTRS